MGKIMLNDVDYSGGGSGGSTVTVTPLLDTGVQIATLTVDDTSYALYAPVGGGSSNISRMTILNTTGSSSTMTATGEVTS